MGTIWSFGVLAIVDVNECRDKQVFLAVSLLCN